MILGKFERPVLELFLATATMKSLCFLIWSSLCLLSHCVGALRVNLGIKGGDPICILKFRKWIARNAYCTMIVTNVIGRLTSLAKKRARTRFEFFLQKLVGNAAFWYEANDESEYCDVFVPPCIDSIQASLMSDSSRHPSSLHCCFHCVHGSQGSDAATPG